LIRLVPARLNSTASERSVAGCCVKGALLAHDSGLFNCSLHALQHTRKGRPVVWITLTDSPSADCRSG
jgi:hypothetical protein